MIKEIHTIEHGIPIPPRKTHESESGMSATLRKMGIGDSVVLPKTKLPTWRKRAKDIGIRLATRTISADSMRIWKLCEARPIAGEGQSADAMVEHEVGASIQDDGVNVDAL